MTIVNIAWATLGAILQIINHYRIRLRRRPSPRLLEARRRREVRKGDKMTYYATNNRAVNRATCSLFIERSLAGIAHPCLRCPQTRVLQDKDDWGYFDTCPCGREKINIEERTPR